MTSIKSFRKIFSLVSAIFFSLVFFLAFNTGPTYASTSFSTAFATMSNSRFSFKAHVSASVAAAASTFTIDSTGPDTDVNNLFPGDTICFNGIAGSGCTDVTTSYKINNSISSTSVGFTPIKVTANAAGDNIVSTQSGTVTVTFKPATNLANGEKIQITFPAASSNAADGIPDSTGFDASQLPADLIAGTGPAPALSACSNLCFVTTGFSVSAATLSTGSSLQTITATISTAGTGSSGPVQGVQYSFQIGKTGTAVLQLINPTPTSTSHTRGVADTYSVTLSTTNSAGSTTYDQTIMKVAPIDGVFVSATVEEAISYTIGAVTTSYTNPCGSQGGGSTPNQNSTGSTVPFGSITTTNTFYNMAQTHTITTNTPTGYVLTVQEDAVLSRDALGVDTIPDTTCNSGPCTTSSPQTWTTTTVNGFGYTLANITGTDAVFTYSQGYKPFSTSAVNVMTKTSPTSSSVIYSCYRLSASTNQKAGYYYNKLTYIATPKF
ncbi:hypothetical protein HY214_01975 [Candidatus Roizmanbacteria bacterium]|nr:hypothetical protein [Candidatus Roizmanbacteria bacterium]